MSLNSVSWKLKFAFFALSIIIVSAFLVAESGASTITIIHPRDGSTLPPAKYTLIGKVNGAKRGKVKVYVGRKKYLFKVNGSGVFFGEIDLRKGSWVTIVAPSGDTVKVSYRVRRGATYRRHLDEAGCGDCHNKDLSVQFPEDINCYSCHDRKDESKFVHGPIGGGACSICHDPHGSGRKSLLRAEVREMCVSCHDQESSKKHINAKKNRKCNRCHNPHGGNDQFFLERRR